ncbi:MAG: hypothetical protein WA130_02585 [Candidatus Methanoperedens sp.]
MSMESIFQKELLFFEPYYGNATPLGYVESPEVSKLISSFEDDKPLCSFFIKNVFKDLPKKTTDNKNDEEINEDYRNLIDFIRTSQILPLCIPHKPSEHTYKFFKRLTEIADSLFQEKIDRRFANICEKAEKIGIIRPELYIDSVKHNGKTFHRIQLHDEKDELFVFDTCLFTFYKISESLFELWIKPENLGMFLEVWIYHLLKSFFEINTDLTIYHRVNIYPKRKQMESIQELANLKQSFIITELDIALFKNTKPICSVECKHNADFSDVIKFYGILKLLNIPEGIFVCVNPLTDEKYRKFENIHIFSNVTENDAFLSKMKGISAEIYLRN